MCVCVCALPCRTISQCQPYCIAALPLSFQLRSHTCICKINMAVLVTKTIASARSGALTYSISSLTLLLSSRALPTTLQLPSRVQPLHYCSQHAPCQLHNSSHYAPCQLHFGCYCSLHTPFYYYIAVLLALQLATVQVPLINWARSLCLLKLTDTMASARPFPLYHTLTANWHQSNFASPPSSHTCCQYMGRGTHTHTHTPHLHMLY